MDECAHLDLFFEFLASDAVWDAIFKDVKAIRAASEDGGWLNSQPFDAAAHHERMEFDLYRTFATSEIEAVFQKHVLDNFLFPPVTTAELVKLGREQLSGTTTEDELRTARSRFLVHLGVVTSYTSDDTNIGGMKIPMGGLRPRVNRLIKAIDTCECIWESQHGFWLALNPVDPFEKLSASIWGKVSNGAMAKLEEVMGRVLPSASTSLHLLNCDPAQPRRFGFIPFEVHEESIADDLLRKENGFLSALLTYYFMPQAKKATSFDQRVRNAVHLLVEADAQTHKAIALSLCFSAIEAMVCDKMEGIVDELSRHVAGLLEPTALNRPDIIRAVKQLYAVRSKALHGDFLADDERAYWKSRLLAAAVLKGAYDWHCHIAKLGDQPNRTDFLNELRTISATGQTMVGVSPELSIFLPKVESPSN